MKYLIVIEKGRNNLSAYLPDIPGCVATGKTVEEVQERMKKALAMHIRGMIEDGQAIPEPLSQADYVDLQQVA